LKYNLKKYQEKSIYMPIKSPGLSLSPSVNPESYSARDDIGVSE
jgi:hypothetical protein